MPRNLASSTIRALDEYARLVYFKELLEIALEELHDPHEKTYDRLQLLLEDFRARYDNSLSELHCHLNAIRELVDGVIPPKLP